MSGTILNFEVTPAYLGAVRGHETARLIEAEAAGRDEPPKRLKQALEPPADATRLSTPGQARDDSESGRLPPALGDRNENDLFVPQDGETDRRPDPSRGGVGSNCNNSIEQHTSSVVSAAAADKIDYRGMAHYWHNVAIDLDARIEELERRLRLRTIAFAGTLTLSGLGAIGTAYLAVTPPFEAPSLAATRIGADGAAHAESAGVIAPALKERMPKPTASSAALVGLETPRDGQQADIGHGNGIGAAVPRAMPAGALDDESGDGLMGTLPARPSSESSRGEQQAGRGGSASPLPNSTAPTREGAEQATRPTVSPRATSTEIGMLRATLARTKQSLERLKPMRGGESQGDPLR